jgi:hypothetical protein
MEIVSIKRRGAGGAFDHWAVELSLKLLPNHTRNGVTHRLRTIFVYAKDEIDVMLKLKKYTEQTNGSDT